MNELEVRRWLEVYNHHSWFFTNRIKLFVSINGYHDAKIVGWKLKYEEISIDIIYSEQHFRQDVPMPISYFWDNDWEIKARHIYEEKRQKEYQVIRERREERDKLESKRLKEKYNE